ncbi:hypothetical protein SAMN05216302_100992 [Nitrosomonas aestuarii]|uniref:Uncharacterized protein n=1 Tax=Nitrosomonas aestuarii TaxID=52441 RepID=A0A1I4ALJ3_9PROT|nr:hypothetical protein [Nitrosomonas aestuarii]SFK57254.1 hypothetical protein SAMN05216302_100992 [Nitrosomonas aestuarii]
MSAYEEDLYDDLAYEDVEGATDFYDDEGDEFESYEDEFDEFDEDDAYAESEFDEFDEYEEFAAMDEFDEFDEYDEMDEFEAFDEYDEDEMDEMLAYALGAEDTDEFFKRLFRGIKRVAKKAAPVFRKIGKGIGKVARVAGPILSKIPHPYAQIGGRVAGVLGRLMADGASEDEALDAMAEYAVQNPRALPVVATIAARSLISRKGARLSKPARKQAVKQMKATAKKLVQTRGRKAIRVLPRIVKSVKRKTAVRNVPPMVKPKIVRRTVAKVIRKPAIVQKLSRPSMLAKKIVKRSARSFSYTTPGPTKITISGA